MKLIRALLSLCIVVGMAGRANGGCCLCFGLETCRHGYQTEPH